MLNFINEDRDDYKNIQLERNNGESAYFQLKDNLVRNDGYIQWTVEAGTVSFNPDKNELAIFGNGFSVEYNLTREEQSKLVKILHLHTSFSVELQAQYSTEMVVG